MHEQKMYGYVRISSKDQKEDRQVAAMREFGVPHDAILIEKVSGKDFNRPVYKQLVQKLKPGDTLVVKSIDRLGRNYDEILGQWRHLTKIIGAAIVVMDMPIIDTRQNSSLIATVVSDMVLQLLSYVAEQERSFNLQRQAEGIAAAKARGVVFGRKPLVRSQLLNDVRCRWECGEITSREAGTLLGVSHTTFLAWVRGE